MTAVAYKDGILAVDTASWRNHLRTGDVVKAVRCRGKFALAAAAGGAGQCTAFLEWAADNCHAGIDLDMPDRENDDGFAGLLVTPSGEVWKVGEKGPMHWVKAPFHVMGCVSDFLAGAMAAGADAERAVQLAIENTDGAAGSVICLRLPKDNLLKAGTA